MKLLSNIALVTLIVGGAAAYGQDVAALLARAPVLFVVRQQYKPDHHNTETFFQTGEVNTASFVPGGALKVIDFAKGGAVTTLLETKEGIIRDPEVSFDGKRILFSMRRNAAEDYHIYEMNADGSGLHPLTGAPGVTDLDPIYLPDGGIVFASTREPKYCMCNQHIMANLFRMESDGANIRQIGKSTLFEGHPALLPDGRILYDRWEYIDRNFGDAQGLWTVNPDGTNHAEYYGNNTWSPGAVIDARPVPESDAVICVFGSCHDRPWGALALVDRRRGMDGEAAVVRTWPAEAAKLVQAGRDQKDYGFDIFKEVNPKFEDPYPLDATHFLCSRATGNAEEMALYLVDTDGNETLVHAEAPGCFDPMPLAPRDTPPVVAPRHDEAKATGTFFVANVYEGTHTQGIAPGAVKFLRVVESPEKRFFTNPAWGGQGVHRPAMNWHDFSNKRILGTVPVEDDGSAYLEAPADTWVYFQLLDERGMMVQSMRSGVIVQRGERLGCVGCHDNRLSAPRTSEANLPKALRRAPSALEGWHGPAREFSFLAEVQPVFTNRCARCHDFDKPAGRKLILAPDKAETFNAAYIELWRLKWTGALGAGPAAIQAPYSWGSHASPLVALLEKGHKNVSLSPEEFDRIVTWIDLNAPYYPTYASAYPDGLAGRNPLTNDQVKRLGHLTKLDFFGLASCTGNQGPQISFDRPEMSPCLARIDSPGSDRYNEALEIIRAGQAMLRERPDADMPGFAPCEADRARETKYELRACAEADTHTAMLEGRRVYDPGIPAPGN